MWLHVHSVHYFNPHVHTRPAGSGFHLPSAAHTALILLAGTNPGLHLKNISAPSVVFRYGSMEPFVCRDCGEEKGSIVELMQKDNGYGRSAHSFRVIRHLAFMYAMLYIYS